MANYDYACDHGRTERSFPIGEAPRSVPGQCGHTLRLVIGAGVQIAPSALETKGVDVRATDARENRWHDDMPAYKRMRAKGMQPPTIDGAARLEDTSGDQIDIDFGRLYTDGVTHDRVIEASEEAAEIQHDWAIGR